MTQLDLLAHGDLTGSRTYVLLYSNQMVKVGFSANFKQRLSTLRREAARHGNPVVEAWCSVDHLSARFTERQAINFCAAAGSRPASDETGEFFLGVDYQAVIRFIEQHIQSHQQAAEAHSAAAAGSWQPCRCDRCDWVDQHPLTAESLIRQVGHGDLVLFDTRTGQRISLVDIYRAPASPALTS